MFSQCIPEVSGYVGGCWPAILYFYGYHIRTGVCGLN